MPFLVTLLAAIGGIAFWLLRARGTARAAGDLMDMAKDVRLAARRFGFTRRANIHPVESIEDMPVSVAALGVAFLQLDDFPGKEQQIALGRGLQSALGVSLTDAEELMILGRWLVAECQTPDAAVPRLSKKLNKLAGADGFDRLMTVVSAVAEAGDGLSAKQREALADIKRAFRIT
ncbi:hypothetical protein [uncultured Maritimibacter sp.]|jgi:hypothetical protein|uniref:hypothetical protein n=1 Tax=uncultured Maritimibacter sp. TaxID=991866 RepID=UPI0026033BF0|nr:hypothetical protein [uncultured Maritimibacter sp.]